MFRQLPPAAPLLRGKDLATGLRATLDHDGTMPSFATALADYFGVDAAFLASSGRTALYLLLSGLSHRQPARREVVLPAYTCPSLVKVIQAAGLETRLCDVSPRTLDFDRGQLAALVGAHTLAVIPVHPFGIPQEVADVLVLAEAAGAVVVEDAAQAMGARLHGRMAGAWGHFGLSSLGPGKALSTGGGGVLLTSGRERTALAADSWKSLSPRPGLASVRALVQMGILAAGFRPAGWWGISRLGLDRLGDRESSWGFQVRGLSHAQAGVGHSLLGHLDAVNAARRQRAAKIVEALGTLPGLRFPEIVPGAEPIYLRLPLLIEGKGRRDRMFDALRAAGIGAGKMYHQPLFHLFPELDGGPEHYPGAEAVARQLLTLPTHHFVNDADVDRMAAITRRTLGQV